MIEYGIKYCCPPRVKGCDYYLSEGGTFTTKTREALVSHDKDKVECWLASHPEYNGIKGELVQKYILVKFKKVGAIV